MELKWVVQQRPERTLIRELAGSLNLPEIASLILVSRGLSTPELAKKFLKPSLNDLFDPFVISGMNTAVERVIKSLTRNEKLMIYGDYDVDGITSASLMFYSNQVYEVRIIGTR